MLKYIFSTFIGGIITFTILLGLGAYFITQDGIGAPSANILRELQPETDNRWDIGTSTIRWRGIFTKYASTTAMSALNNISIGRTSTTTIEATATSTFQGGINIVAGGIDINLPSCSGTSVLETDANGAIT